MPVEISFVDDDLSRQAGIGIHADAKHESARLCLADIDIEISSPPGRIVLLSIGIVERR